MISPSTKLATSGDVASSIVVEAHQHPTEAFDAGNNLEQPPGLLALAFTNPIKNDGVSYVNTTVLLIVSERATLSSIGAGSGDEVTVAVILIL